ncbi:polyprenyl synthetase family protein [Streptomyces sp. NPDC051987]|uniref:polyprenyl synthetase family protein n=1 Tax=Streptomyces sp. NPDC051987 TaxID=3155808 RepID=UPI003430A321
MSALDTSSTGVPASLSPKTVRATVWPVIRQQASAPEPTPARMCSGHLGLTDAHGASSGAPGGNLSRSALTTAAADGVGLRPGGVRWQAAAREPLHNSTLIHDDIIDADESRRGRPAARKVFGVGPAVLAAPRGAVRHPGLAFLTERAPRHGGPNLDSGGGRQ